MRFDIITAHPDSLASYLDASIIARARKSKHVDIRVHDLRDFTKDKHRKIDSKPYGGGAGMVLQVEPIWRAVKKVKSKKKKERCLVLVTSAAGKMFDQRAAEKFSKLDQIILICGHYEGIDERVMKFADKKISIGQYVLTGGELPALVVVDAVTRLIPGVLGNPESLVEESFWMSGKASTTARPTPLSLYTSIASAEYPHYTRPEVFAPIKGARWKVPSVLLSGDHKKIAAWREKKIATPHDGKPWGGDGVH